MCNACVLESVKSTMLSRRSLFRGVAASGAAAVAAGLVGARPALAQSSGRVVDLTHTLDAAFPTFDGKPGITIDKVVDFAKDGYNINKLTILEHSGTHIDTPLHFTADGASVDELAPEKLVCPLCVIDIRAKAAEDPNAMVLPEDIEAWVSANGAIAAGSLVAMNSGWAAKIGDASFRNTPDGKLAFPGFSKAATEMLAGLDVAAIGVDTLSLDPGDSADFAVHYQWLPSGRYGVENMAGLDGVPAAGATIFVGAPKHRKGSGGPARVMAVV